MPDIFNRIIDIETDPAGIRVYYKAVSPGARQAVEGSTVVVGAGVNSTNDVYTALRPIVITQFALIDRVVGGKVTFGGGDKFVNL